MTANAPKSGGERLAVTACGLDWEGYLLACWWLGRDGTSCPSFWVEVETHLHSSLFCVFLLWLWVWWLNQVCSFHFFHLCCEVLGGWELYPTELAWAQILHYLRCGHINETYVFYWLLLFQLCIRPPRWWSTQNPFHPVPSLKLSQSQLFMSRDTWLAIGMQNQVMWLSWERAARLFQPRSQIRDSSDLQLRIGSENRFGLSSRTEVVKAKMLPNLKH